MMRRVWALAYNTFRDAIRRRVLYGIIGVVFVVNMFSMVLGEMSLHQEARVARDLGLAGLSLFGSVTAIFLGVSLLYSEIKKRTIHTIVSKPLERYEFVLGKYLGMCITLTCLVLLFSLAMFLLLFIQSVGVDGAILKAVFLAYMEVLIVAAIAIFFSSFSTPFLSGIFTFGLFVVGRTTPDVRAAIARLDSEFAQDAFSALLYAIPDLHLFTGEYAPTTYLFQAIGYAACLIVVLLALSIFVFSRRDFV